MAIELPDAVVKLLNFIGIPWINVNEDKVRDFATHVRTFASNVTDVHQDATATINQLGSSYEGAAYDALTSMWKNTTTGHIGTLTEACGDLATALEVGAGFIEGQKIACLGTLAGMAVAFVADQAAAVFTFGISEAALPGIEAAATKAISYAEDQIEQHVVGEISNAALQPLLGKIDDLVQGLEFGVGGGGSSGSPGSGVKVDPPQLRAAAQRMRAHADTLEGHVSTFTSSLASVDFNS